MTGSAQSLDTGSSEGPSGSAQAGHGVSPDDPRFPIFQSLKEFADRAKLAVTIVDPHQHDRPVIYINEAFSVLSGYAFDEAVGQNCRFMQGADTDRDEVARIRGAIESGDNCIVELLNYRKDGSTFWNAMHISPVLDDSGEVAFYYGSQWNVTGRIAHRSAGQVRQALSREMHHRLRNLLAVASSIVRLSGQGDPKAANLIQKASERIQALGRAHEATFSPTGEDYAMADLYSVISAMLKSASPDEQSCISWSGPDVQLPVAAITPLALSLHELIVNAREHGALARDGGRVDVVWEQKAERLHMVWSEYGVGKIDPAENLDGFGTRSITNILRSIGGTTQRSWTDDGICVELSVNCETE